MTPRRMNKLLSVALCVLVAIIIIGLFFANRRLTTVANQTAKNRAEIEITSAQISSYQRTKTKIDSLNYVEELAGTVLPSGKDESTIVAELSQFAQRARLSVAEIAFLDQSLDSKTSGKKTNPTLPKGVEVVPITIKLKSGARFENVLEFLRLVENNRRAMQVTTIALTPEEENRSLLSDITISINLYNKKGGGV